MSFAILTLLIIIVLAILCFWLERWPVEVVALGVVISLVCTGLINSEQAFSGFSSGTVVTIFGLLVMTAALVRTGVVDIAGAALFKFGSSNPTRLLIIIIVAACLIGAFMSNTAATAFFLPLVLGVAQKTKTSPSKLLMPLAFASILSSSITLVSTSTNLVVNGMMVKYKMEPMGMFELAPVGIPIAVIGLIYVLTIGRRLIPDRTSGMDASENVIDHLYLTEVVILPSSPLVGKTLALAAFGSKLDLNVLKVIRNKEQYFNPRAELMLKAGDMLLVEGQRDSILKIKDEQGIDIKAESKFAGNDLQGGDVQLVEAMVSPRSPLLHRTLKGFRFRERYGAFVLALNRHGVTQTTKISEIPLRLGDLLLIQGTRESLNYIQQNRALRMMTSVEEHRVNTAKAPIALAIFVGSLAATVAGLIPMTVAVILGVMLIFLTRCITPEDAYREIEWKAVLLIGCMLALGVAMEETGTAKYLADHVLNIIGQSGPLVLLGTFFWLTVLLTQPMSNQAAAIVIFPVAIQAAITAGFNPRSFAMMIAVAASCSYLTPLEPSCLMVYGPGRYRFTDFLKVGSGLTVIIFIIALYLVPKIWPVMLT